MREVIWMSGVTTTMVQQLNSYLGGEIVKFGDDTWIIVGDDNVKAKFDAAKEERKEANKE